ncbi:uncharacterized protein LOC129304236 [Prosopis cineraria]|uniref:uncharacterized protein LOC129304236 n=1 Tax=Prosopis cineraria TaxID=364024 RepID=UPI00240F5E26|nr:uncharacterized protein LOC129304236 [Prosopis cineraria]XP_054799915.1 uncharacterized protein LOC129304236 [Prosopis cineraria]
MVTEAYENEEPEVEIYPDESVALPSAVLICNDRVVEGHDSDPQELNDKYGATSRRRESEPVHENRGSVAVRGSSIIDTRGRSVILFFRSRRFNSQSSNGIQALLAGIDSSIFRFDFLFFTFQEKEASTFSPASRQFFPLVLFGCVINCIYFSSSIHFCACGHLQVILNFFLAI